MINPVLLCSGCVVIMINPVLLGSGCVVIMINLVSLGSGCVIIIIIPICYIPAGSVVNHPDNSCLLCSRVCALHDKSYFYLGLSLCYFGFLMRNTTIF